jgi:membrane protein DedA with SNARE-associated domain
MSIIAALHLHIQHFHGPAVDYLGLALAAAASWIGVPGPGEPVLIAAAVIAARHKLDISGVLLVAWAAAAVGGMLGWLVGRIAGRRVATAHGPLYQLRLNAVARGEEIFGRWPVVAIVLAPSWVAGIHGVRTAVFVPVNAVGAALWALGIGIGAYVVGPAVVDAVDDLGLVTGIAFGVLVALGVAAEIRRRVRRRRRADLPPSGA